MGVVQWTIDVDIAIVVVFRIVPHFCFLLLRARALSGNLGRAWVTAELDEAMGIISNDPRFELETIED